MYWDWLSNANLFSCDGAFPPSEIFRLWDIGKLCRLSFPNPYEIRSAVNFPRNAMKERVSIESGGGWV
jgi:hypothetical protein